MKNSVTRSLFMALVLALSAAISVPAWATGKAELDRSSRAALNKLVAKVPAAKALNSTAVAVLVFPKITKAGPNLPWIALKGFADGFDTVEVPEVRNGMRVVEVAQAMELA